MSRVHVSIRLQNTSAFLCNYSAAFLESWHCGNCVNKGREEDGNCVNKGREEDGNSVNKGREEERNEVMKGQTN